MARRHPPESAHAAKTPLERKEPRAESGTSKPRSAKRRLLGPCGTTVAVLKTLTQRSGCPGRPPAASGKREPEPRAESAPARPRGLSSRSPWERGRRQARPAAAGDAATLQNAPDPHRSKAWTLRDPPRDSTRRRTPKNPRKAALTAAGPVRSRSPGGTRTWRLTSHRPDIGSVTPGGGAPRPHRPPDCGAGSAAAAHRGTHFPLAECLAVILSSSFLPVLRSCLPSMQPVCTAFSGSQKVIWEFRVATASSAPSGRKVTARAGERGIIRARGRAHGPPAATPSTPSASLTPGKPGGQQHPKSAQDRWGPLALPTKAPPCGRGPRPEPAPGREAPRGAVPGQPGGRGQARGQAGQGEAQGERNRGASDRAAGQPLNTPAGGQGSGRRPIGEPGRPPAAASMSQSCVGKQRRCAQGPTKHPGGVRGRTASPTHTEARAPGSLLRLQSPRAQEQQLCLRDGSSGGSARLTPLERSRTPRKRTGPPTPVAGEQLGVRVYTCLHLGQMDNGSETRPPSAGDTLYLCPPCTHHPRSGPASLWSSSCLPCPTGALSCPRRHWPRPTSPG